MSLLKLQLVHKLHFEQEMIYVILGFTQVVLKPVLLQLQDFYIIILSDPEN